AVAAGNIFYNAHTSPRFREGFMSQHLCQRNKKTDRRVRIHPSSCKTPKRKALDGFLQFLGGTEGDLLASLDLDLLAGRGIASHARGALADLQDAKSVETDLRTLLQVLGDRGRKIVQDRGALLVCKAL